MWIKWNCSSDNILFTNFHLYDQEDLGINRTEQLEKWDLLQQGEEELTPSLVYCSFQVIVCILHLQGSLKTQVLLTLCRGVQL